MENLSRHLIAVKLIRSEINTVNFILCGLEAGSASEQYPLVYLKDAEGAKHHQDRLTGVMWFKECR